MQQEIEHAGKVGAVDRLPISIPDLRGREADYLTQCVETNWVSSAGAFVTDFESAIADYVGVARGVAIVNGTCAIELALRVAGVGPGDVVLVPDWTFAATANAVRHTGAVPHFVDVSLESWTMDPQLLEAAIAVAQGRVAAVLPVHALGHPPDLDAIGRIASAYGIPVIEDAAGAIGSSYKGRIVGGQEATAAVLSFNGNKLLTCGNGGMILTDNDTFADRARYLSAQARRSGAYEYTEVAFNYRMSNVNAAIGLAQFERLSEMLAARRAVAARYRQFVDGSSRLSFMPTMDWANSNCWLSAIRCDSERTAVGLTADMSAAGIDAVRFWQPLSKQPPFRDHGRTLTGVSAELGRQVVVLPSSSSLTDADLDRILRVLETWR